MMILLKLLLVLFILNTILTSNDSIENLSAIINIRTFKLPFEIFILQSFIVNIHDTQSYHLVLSTLLCIPFKIHMFKRFYPSQPVITETQPVLLNKKFLYEFCEHFKRLSFNELLKDCVFINYMDKCIHHHLTLHSKAFQLALEMTYSHWKFNLEELFQYYSHDFIITDSFNINKGVCDQNTIFSSILTKNLVDFVRLDKQDVIVNPTPLFLTKGTVRSDVKTCITYNKEMTDNSCPDVSITKIPYDYKETKDVSYNKNHIYFVDQENVGGECCKYIKLLKSSLLSNLANSSVKNEIKCYSEHIIKIITNGYHTNQSSLQIYKGILLFVKNNTPPKTFKMPIIIYKNKANIINLSAKVTMEEALIVPLDGGTGDERGSGFAGTMAEGGCVGLRVRFWDPILRR